MLSDAQIVRFNPWWANQAWEAEDPHLRRLEAQPVRLPAPQVEEIDLERAAVHVLRGPRQVGKSTDLKLIVRRTLAKGTEPRAVLYLSLDLLEGQPPSALVETVGRALELAGGGEGPRLILLDEVTSAGRWQTAVKALWDGGRIDRDVVLCTGSSAIDLAEGSAERLPGRRGPGRDFLVLPQDFAAFARATDAANPPSPGLSVAEIVSPDGQEAMLAARVHLPSLQRALERYLRFGGLPAAVAEAAGGRAEPSEEVQTILWDSLVREVARRGASIPAAQALLERVMRSLGSKLSWSRMAREMAVALGRRGAKADPRTVQSYVELLAVNYFALVLYFWKQDSGSGERARDERWSHDPPHTPGGGGHTAQGGVLGGPNSAHYSDLLRPGPARSGARQPRTRGHGTTSKKVYFGDPLLASVVAERVGLARDPHAEVENALALALYRRYEPAERSAENFAAPERLHVWGTRRGGEIDFVCGPRERVEAVEVADWAAVDRRKATAPIRALPGRPALVASRDELEFGTSANLVPAALALWALSR